MQDSDVLARAERIPALLAMDPHLIFRGRFLTCGFLLGIGDAQHHIELRNGVIESLTRGPSLMRSWRFALRGDEEAWERFWAPIPQAGFHDILALTKAGRFRLEGDLYPFLSNLLFFKDLLSLPRKTESRP